MAGGDAGTSGSVDPARARVGAAWAVFPILVSAIVGEMHSACMQACAVGSDIVES